MLYRVDQAVKDDPRTWIVDAWFPNHQDAVVYTHKWSSKPTSDYRIVPVATE